jgi:hypothetical protein
VRRTLFAVRTVLLLGLLAACGGNQQQTLPDAAYDCTVETRADTFSAGMMKNGSQNQITFKLMESKPAPPSRGDNEWSIDIVDATTQQPITGAAVTVTPFMPDHNHGTQIKAVVTEPTPGHYLAKPVNLWMPGLWQVTIKATPTGGTADAAVFAFCISG